MFAWRNKKNINIFGLTKVLNKELCMQINLEKTGTPESNKHIKESENSRLGFIKSVHQFLGKECTQLLVNCFED